MKFIVSALIALSCFAALATAASAQSEFERQIVTRDDLTTLGLAIGFCRGQQLAAEGLAAANPQVAPALKLELFRFHQATGNACEDVQSAIKKFLQGRAKSALEADRAWIGLEEQIDSGLQAAIQTQPKSAEAARQFVQELSNRAAGKMDQGILRTLLSSSTELRKAPALEYTRGFTRQYRSAGDKKSGEVSVQLKLPLSWREKEGDAPHVPHKWSTIIGANEGVLVVTLFVLQMSPSELEEMELEIQRGEFGDLVAGIQESMPGARVENSKRIQLMMRPGVEAQVSLLSGVLDKEMRFRGLMYSGLARGGAVSVYCSVGGAADASRIDAWFERYRPLCQLVAASLYDVCASSP
jgi:hypothetical protein